MEREARCLIVDAIYPSHAKMPVGKELIGRNSAGEIFTEALSKKIVG